MKELTVLTNNNERVLTTKQLADVYETEISNIKKNLSVNKSRFVEGKHYYKLTGDELKEFKANYLNDSNLIDKRTPSLILWTKEGCLEMASIKENISEESFDIIKQYFDIKDIALNRVRKENNFINSLEQVLKPINIKGITQYSVDKYRIDFYIPELKIAIEYDESEHESYSYENQEGRQKYIENKLKCKFIRVTDKNSDLYNVGLIINYIFKNNHEVLGN